MRIILGAARGLSAGHRAGIVHRDVKPANILLARQGGEESVRVLDFGIAKALGADPEDDLTRLGGVPHTPAYASPEQQRPGSPLSAASDVYQLGLVAYELMAGARPFDADQRERIQAGEDLALPVRGRWEQAPPPLRAVVERALRTAPADRFPDASAFAEAWSRAPADDHTIAAPGIAPPIVHDATVAQVPPASSGGASPSGAPSAGAAWAASARERWGALPREARIGAAALVAVLLLWLMLRGSGDEPVVVETAETVELEERFAPLYREAAERLEEEAR